MAQVRDGMARSGVFRQDQQKVDRIPGRTEGDKVWVASMQIHDVEAGE